MTNLIAKPPACQGLPTELREKIYQLYRPWWLVIGDQSDDMFSVSSIYGEIKASRHYLIGLQKLQWETLDSTLRQSTTTSSTPGLKDAIMNYQEVQRDVEAKLDAQIADIEKVICYVDDREVSLREWHRNRRTRPFPDNILQMHYVKLPKARPVPAPSESPLVPHCSALPNWLNEKVSLRV
ncbi:MAG: hypothetical protein Q9183_007590 [Haloplaca sp. 2 TL-2023]